MKKKAHANSTIRAAVEKRLRYFAKNCLFELPKVVEVFIAEKNCSPAF